MTASDQIKTAFERHEQGLAKQPALGQKTGKVKVSSLDGLSCEIESGPWKLQCDMSKNVGGNETGPSPGILEAGALGSCIVIMTKMWGAKLDIPINHIEIMVEFDTDIRMLFGLNDTPSHWKAIRYQLTVESDAHEAEIRKVLNLAHQHSHVRGDLEYAFHIERTISIKRPPASTV